MAQAVARQCRQLEAIPFPNQHETALARLLAPHIPVDDPLFRSTSSGSEAVLPQRRLADHLAVTPEVLAAFLADVKAGRRDLR